MSKLLIAGATAVVLFGLASCGGSVRPVFVISVDHARPPRPED